MYPDRCFRRVGMREEGPELRFVKALAINISEYLDACHAELVETPVKLRQVFFRGDRQGPDSDKPVGKLIRHCCHRVVPEPCHFLKSVGSDANPGTRTRQGEDLFVQSKLIHYPHSVFHVPKIGVFSQLTQLVSGMHLHERFSKSFRHDMSKPINNQSHTTLLFVSQISHFLEAICDIITRAAQPST